MFIKARGVPLSVHLMQETAKLQKQCNYVIKEMSVLRQEQTKLSELIPLSAAGSGMVIGTRQLNSLRSHLETSFTISFVMQASREIITMK